MGLHPPLREQRGATQALPLWLNHYCRRQHGSLGHQPPSSRLNNVSTSFQQWPGELARDGDHDDRAALAAPPEIPPAAVQPARDRFGLGAHPCGLAAAAADEGEARPRRRRWCQAASTSSGRAWPLLVLLIGPGGAVSSAATSTIVTCAGTRDLRNRSAPPHRRPEPAPAASATNQTAVPRRGTGNRAQLTALAIKHARDRRARMQIDPTPTTSLIPGPPVFAALPPRQPRR